MCPAGVLLSYDDGKQMISRIQFLAKELPTVQSSFDGYHQETPILGSTSEEWSSFRDETEDSIYITSIKTCTDRGALDDSGDHVITSVQSEAQDLVLGERDWNALHGATEAKTCRRFWLNDGNCIRKVRVWADHDGVRRLDFISNK